MSVQVRESEQEAVRLGAGLCGAVARMPVCVLPVGSLPSSPPDMGAPAGTRPPCLFSSRGKWEHSHHGGGGGEGLHLSGEWGRGDR